MIKYFTGDLLKTDAPIIMHGCNSKGVMGSGVAKQIRERWPFVYTQYHEGIKQNKEPLGMYFPVVVYPKGSYRKIIVNLITQERYGRIPNVRYASPDAIFTSMESCIRELNFHSGIPIATPKIGCGLGGLDWEKDVLPIYERLDVLFDVDFWVYSL